MIERYVHPKLSLQDVPGMTLRELYAGWLMSELILLDASASYESIAVQACRAADALLAELEKKK